MSVTRTRAPASARAAQAVSPSMPAPITRTRRPATVPAASIAAITVAVAHAAGAATASGMMSGTFASAVPAGSTTCSAYAPDSGQSPSKRSWPTLRSDAHFAVNPDRQRTQRPHETVTDQTMRSPTAIPLVPPATTVPTASCPSTDGHGARRRRVTVCRSLPHTVASSTRTSVSPSASSGSSTFCTSTPLPVHTAARVTRAGTVSIRSAHQERPARLRDSGLAQPHPAAWYRPPGTRRRNAG